MYPIIKQISILLVLFISLKSYSQDIPTERLTNWNNAGLHKSITYIKSINISDYKSFVSEDESYNSALIEAFKVLGIKGGIVKFNEGDYLFTQSIVMPSNILLSGVSSSKTKFIFNLKGKSSCIVFKGLRNSPSLKFKEKTEVNSRNVELNGFLEKGTYAFLQYKNKSVLSDSWAYNHFGQMFFVEDVIGENIAIKAPLRLSIADISIADIIPVSAIYNSGVENLKIVRIDKTKDKTSNILFDYAANCFVSGIESDKANFAHVDIRHSLYITIIGSYFHHSFSYGSGGVGYGVVTQFSSSDNLIEDNVFAHLRHSMLVQSGANGNVFGYNYSTDPYWNQGFFPSGSAGDIVLHGNFPFLNLFEGNIAQNLVIDGSHGINGPYNTFFRNRLEYLGVSAVAYPMTNSQNFVANEITANGLFSGLFIVLGKDHFSRYNLVRGTITPDISIAPKITSLYGQEVKETEKIGVIGNYNKTILNAKTRFSSSETTKAYTLYKVENKTESKTVKRKKKRRFWFKRRADKQRESEFVK